MTKSEQLAARVTPETVKQIEDLRKLWGPVQPLSTAAVLAECVKRAHETTKKEKRK